MQSHLRGICVPRVPALQRIPHKREHRDVLPADRREHVVLRVFGRMQGSESDIRECENGIAAVLSSSVGAGPLRVPTKQ